jgi:hypothetical protein
LSCLTKLMQRFRPRAETFVCGRVAGFANPVKEIENFNRGGSIVPQAVQDGLESFLWASLYADVGKDLACDALSQETKFDKRGRRIIEDVTLGCQCEVEEKWLVWREECEIG